MPAPKPLTACDPPNLDWSRPEAPAAVDFGDIYFSVDGGLEETEAVYLAGCGLPARWAGRRNFVIGELGFGSGLNVLAVWRMWDRYKPEAGHLHIISVEKFPFSREQLSRALSAWPELAEYAARLITLWPGRVKGAHVLHLTPNLTLTLIHDDVLEALSNLSANVDAWFLDGFSPAKNPGMWSAQVMSQIESLSAPGARIGTFTVAGMVREGLKDAGFAVEKKEGFGRKRHRLEAIFPGIVFEAPQNIRPIILGAGIAGASLARSFLRRGVIPIIIDPDDGTAASGNPAAIVKPRLDLQDRPESRFFLSSYLYALQAYHADGHVLSESVFHGAKTPEELTRFEKLASLASLPEDHICLAEGPFGLKGLNFAKAVTLDPIKTCLKFANGAERIRGRAAVIDNVEDEIVVKGQNGTLLARGSHVFAALGAGIREFTPLSDLSLRYSRGQISTTKTDITQTVTYGGYAVPMKGVTLIGATHARLGADDPYITTGADDQENSDKFEAVTGMKPAIIAGSSRASIRVTQANTLPRVHKKWCNDCDYSFRVTGLCVCAAFG